MADQQEGKAARLPRAFTPDLTAAMRRARLEDAEREQTAAELRSGEIGRLEQLRLALQPVFAQTGLHADAFDHGLVPGDTPKLFIDMIAFIDCGHDRKGYRFVQGARDGPRVLAQNERIDPIVDAVTMYVARRIVEREKALAAADAPPTRAEPVKPTPPREARFGQMLAIYIVGALCGAALLYALFKLGLAP